MKRILVMSALALALLPGLALAQTINRSLQGSQDPRGPVGLDSSNSAYFPGHINAFGQFTTATSATLCGAGGVLATNSNDVTGTLTEGATTACSVQFGSPFNAAPFCQVTIQSLGVGVTTGTSVVVTARTTGFNLTNGSSGNIYNYLCIGGLGG